MHAPEYVAKNPPHGVFKALFMVGLISLLLMSCFDEEKKLKQPGTKKVVASDIEDSLLGSVAERRGLTSADLLAAVETYVPTGGRDDYLGLVGTGTAGQLAVFALPSMRILKFAGVFTPEAWQGFAYDDQSKAIVEASAREDIIYEFGDIGLPVLSLTDAQYDGRSAYLVDAANARMALFDLYDYETKQIVVNPYFRGSYPSLSPTSNSEFVMQVTSAPEVPVGKWFDFAKESVESHLRGGATFWAIERPAVQTLAPGEAPAHEHVKVEKSFTIELPPYFQAHPLTGRGSTAEYAFALGRCQHQSVAKEGSAVCDTSKASVLHILSWKKALGVLKEFNKVSGQVYITNTEAVKHGLISQVILPAGIHTMSLSPDGGRLVLSSQKDNHLYLLNLVNVLKTKPDSKDAFQIPTVTLSESSLKKQAFDGLVSDVSFASNSQLYATANAPGRLLRISTEDLSIQSTLDLDYQPRSITIPGANTAQPDPRYAVLANLSPNGRFISTGPIQGLNPQLIDISGETMRPLYDMSVPHANALRLTVYNANINKPIARYKSGTDTRTGQISMLRTVAGQEKIIREGKRVHVFATVIRSHITPELVEVNEGDTVSFHITNLEQAQDQTHGFTVDTYNVHGSWEPGKTASVTFVADRPGVFPYYCTEFCSALHLEMEGYLMVKPRGWKASKEDLTEAVVLDSGDDKAEFEEKMVSIKETQATIDSVVVWLQEHDFASDDRAAALVKDAQNQLEQAKGVQPKIDAAVNAGNWSSARLWAEQYFQYQVKAADAGLRAKKIISEQGGDQ